MESQLPDNDKDRLLARTLSQWLGQDNRTSSETDDPLAGILKIFRNEELTSRLAAGSPSPNNWIQISRALEKGTENKARVYNATPNWKIWLSAAAVVLLFFTGLFVYFSSQNARLLMKTTGSKQVFAMADGSHITLRPHSAIYLIHRSPHQQVYRLKGEALFDIVHNPARDFTVRSGNGEVTVLGTQFDMSDWGGKVQVYLERGKVAFKDLKTSERVILNPGEASSIDSKGRLSKPTSQKSTQYLDWLSDYLTFHHQTVRHVFDELQQQYKISIITDPADTTLLNETVSGQIHLTELKQTLKNISLVVGGKFIKENNREYRFLPNTR